MGGKCDLSLMVLEITFQGFHRNAQEEVGLVASGCLGECEGAVGRGWGKGRWVCAVPSVEEKVHSTGVVRPGTPWDGRRSVSASPGTGAQGPA